MSRKKAIDAKCKDCIYDKYSKGTWREQVENCAEKTCSLYQYRPIQNKVNKNEIVG